MAIARRLFWLAIFVTALIGGWKFAGTNGAPVAVDYLFGTFPAVPLWLALVTSAAAGAGIATAGLSARLTRSSLAQRRYRKTVAALESEVHQLRNLPVASGLAEARPDETPPGGRGADPSTPAEPAP